MTTSFAFLSSSPYIITLFHFALCTLKSVGIKRTTYHIFPNLIHIFQTSVGFGNECFLFISGNHYEHITCYLTSKTRQVVWIRNASDLCWLIVAFSFSSWVEYHAWLKYSSQCNPTLSQYHCELLSNTYDRLKMNWWMFIFINLKMNW
jgi:hypothetical protein